MNLDLKLNLNFWPAIVTEIEIPSQPKVVLDPLKHVSYIPINEAVNRVFQRLKTGEEVEFLVTSAWCKFLFKVYEGNNPKLYCVYNINVFIEKVIKVCNENEMRIDQETLSSTENSLINRIILRER